MERKTHLPLWFKERVAKVEELGHKAGAKQAWELIERHFGHCKADTAMRDEGQALRITLDLPFATAEKRISWDRIEAFRERFRLRLDIHVSESEGLSYYLLDFFPEQN